MIPAHSPNSIYDHFILYIFYRQRMVILISDLVYVDSKTMEIISYFSPCPAAVNTKKHGQQGELPIFSSITSIILLVKYKELHKMFVWTLGSFSGKNWNDFYFLLPVTVVCIVLLALCPKYLDILGSGEVTAISLGLDYKKARILVLCAGSLAAATAVCMGGTIGFVGLIVPHLVRKFAGPGHGQLLTLSLLWGAVFVILCDLVARIAFPPSEIPVGVITALAGAPFFVSLLFARESRKDLLDKWFFQKCGVQRDFGISCRESSGH